jgi:hypothetical protein
MTPANIVNTVDSVWYLSMSVSERESAQNAVFVQGGAPLHIAVFAQQRQDEKFPGRWLG